MAQLPAPVLSAQREVDLAQLIERRAHALLIEAAPEQGQFALALALAQTWLCEQSDSYKHEHGRYCGACDSCHLFSKLSHPDLRLLAPETMMLECGWPLSEKAQDELDKKKRKPSKEIRIDAMLSAIEFSQRSASRAHGKVMVIYPAQAMNTVTANALLKTLEEPPASLRFILATDASHQLLPTIRSRCQSYRLRWSDPERSQIEARKDLPKLLREARIEAFDGLSPAQAVQLALQVCHDAWMHKLGSPLRYYHEQDMPTKINEKALADWHKMLLDLAKTAEHPFKPELFLENLVVQSSLFLNSRAD